MLMLQKSRMLQLQGVQGWASTELSRSQAVVAYRNPLATQKMPYHRLSRRVNNRTTFLLLGDVIFGEINETAKISQKNPVS